MNRKDSKAPKAPKVSAKDAKVWPKPSKIHIVNVQREQLKQARFSGKAGPGRGHKSYVPTGEPELNSLDLTVDKAVTQEVKNQMGRPRLEFNMATFESLCQIWCTKEEICHVFRMSHDTLQERIAEHYKDLNGVGRTFTSVYDEYKAYGNLGLRRKQRQVAVSNGNVSMLIWLGQQELNQSNKSQMNGGGFEETDKLTNEYEIRETLYKEGSRADTPSVDTPTSMSNEEEEN